MDNGVEKPSRLFRLVERLGNILPDPSVLFLIGLATVMVVSAVAHTAEWEVTKTVLADGQPVSKPVKAVNLLSPDGFYWLLSNMVTNFIGFPPLGIVIVSMLGIGLAERTGLLGSLFSCIMIFAPRRLLTPAVVFVCCNSSLAIDAGFVVLPPIAAALYARAGRSPIAGLLAAFAGVGIGFTANVMVTGIDALLVGFTQDAARLVDPNYRVAVTCNWWFNIASTILLTLICWAVTDCLVEPKLGLI